MSTKVVLNLDEAIYERARLLAEQQRQDVAKALVHWLEVTLPPSEPRPASGTDAPTALDEDAAVEREMQAYIALHTQLLPEYMHQYVAIHGGQLIDHDRDYETLLRRIEAAYPDEFVWLTEVEDQPIQEVFFRSPRLSRNSE
jgi:hypothetical protein